MKHTILYITSALFILSLTSCLTNNKESKKTNVTHQLKRYETPQAPTTLFLNEDKVDYIISRYWNKYNFNDTSLIDTPNYAEQAFVDFINLLPQSRNKIAAESLNNMLNKAKQDSLVYEYFTELSERYFYEPNSPYRSEDYYIIVLNNIVDNEKLSSIMKIRPKYQLNLSMRNRIGDRSNDFIYTLANGKNNRLYNLKSDYTLLFFNNPDCEMCKEVKNFIVNSPVIQRMLVSKQLQILAIYPDKDLSLWKQESYPKEWINSYDKGETLTKKSIYDLKAIPSLYLLDKGKTVLLKDTYIEVVENWFHNQIQNKTITRQF